MHGKHKIRAARADQGLTQKALSMTSGVSASTISHIECHRGPDVPRTERKRTTTKYSTAMKLAVALSKLPPGDYSFDEFVGSQALFTEAELYEALVNVQERKRRRRVRSRKHLRLVG